MNTSAAVVTEQTGAGRFAKRVVRRPLPDAGQR